jgi:hypothetical protein
VTAGFVGEWSVTEYVHDPDGAFRGRVRQERHLQRRPEGSIRVTQRCRPDATLAGHPMGEFSGDWVFDGEHRRYQGPDVVGSATEWAPGAMTGTGVWPRFGHDFDSYAVLAADDRQLTGGRFGVQARPAAVIVGVAVPVSPSANAGPELDLDWWPDGRWVGAVERQGAVTPLERHFSATGWSDQGDGSTPATVTIVDGAVSTVDDCQGVAQRFGPSLRASWWSEAGHRRDVLLVADAMTGTVAGFETETTPEATSVSVVRLAPG